MKALSVKQPWAELIASGIKTIETRIWHTHFRGPLLICSSKKPAAPNFSFQCPRCFNFNSFRVLYANPHEETCCLICKNRVFPRLIYPSLSGVALCKSILIDWRPRERCDQQDACCGLYQGAFAWVLSDVKRIVPFAINGQQRLFEVNYAQ
jgi:hypothetical protein